MTRIKLVKHARGAPGLRLLGLGPCLTPTKGLFKLRRLLSKHAFWANNRSYKQLRKMLRGSNVIVTIWRGKRLVGFGRANSDGIYRAVLWDVVVAGDLRGEGLGRRVLKALIESKELRNVERVYLMTTKSFGFYLQSGFDLADSQRLMIKTNKID